MQIKRLIKVHDIVYKISLQKKKFFFKKTIKSLGLPNKSGVSTAGALAENQIVKHLNISN